MSLYVVASVLAVIAVSMGLLAAACAHAMGPLASLWKKHDVLFIIMTAIPALAALLTFVTAMNQQYSKHRDECQARCGTQRALSCGEYSMGTSEQERDTRFAVCRTTDGGVDIKPIE